MPSSCATSWAKVVSWPWPWDMQDTASTAEPVGFTRSWAPSAMPSPAMSISARGPAPTASVKKLIPTPSSVPRPVAACSARRLACSRRSSSYPAISKASASVRG